MPRVCTGLLVAWVALCGCSRSAPHRVDSVDVSGPTVADNALLGLSPAQVQALLTQSLKADRGFIFPKPGEHVAEGAPSLKLNLELAFTRTSQKQARPGTYGEVGATLEIKRETVEGAERYEVAGLGDARVVADTPEGRRDSLRKALASAIENAVVAARLQLAAIDKRDVELIRDLASADSREKEFAVRVLADRKNPAVTPSLLEKLKGTDADEVRRAIGELVEIRDLRAVPPLIELARGKDYSFLREIIFALGQIGGDEAEAYLDTVADGHDQPEIREAAKQALEELRQSAHHTRAQGTNERDSKGAKSE